MNHPTMYKGLEAKWSLMYNHTQLGKLDFDVQVYSWMNWYLQRMDVVLLQDMCHQVQGVVEVWMSLSRDSRELNGSEESSNCSIIHSFFFLSLPYSRTSK